MPEPRSATPAYSLHDASLDYLQVLLFSRTYLFTLFHKALGGVPNAQLLEILGCPTTLDALDEYAGEEPVEGRLRDYLAYANAQDCENTLLDRAKAEYTRALVGPGKLPAVPWASPHLSGEAAFMQEGTLAVRAIYRAHGLKPAACGHVPDDHVALLCGFAAIQAQEALDALRDGDFAHLRALMEEQCVFERDYLASWLPAYASGLCHLESPVLYPQLAKGLAGFVQKDCDLCANVIAFIDENPTSPGDPAQAQEGATGLAALVDAQADLTALRELRLFGLEENELRRA